MAPGALFLIVVIFCVATPDFLSTLPLLNCTEWTLCSMILVFSKLFLLRFAGRLAPVAL